MFSRSSDVSSRISYDAYLRYYTIYIYYTMTPRPKRHTVCLALYLCFLVSLFVSPPCVPIFLCFVGVTYFSISNALSIRDESMQPNQLSVSTLQLLPSHSPVPNYPCLPRLSCVTCLLTLLHLLERYK